MKKAGGFFALCVLIMLVLPAMAETTIPFPDISGKDRILIFAPHPDDESIGCGGVIQEALRAGAQIKVCYFTSGDHNELSFVVYKKRVPLRQKAFLKLGEMRRQESVKAMEYFGLSKDQLTFLCYPDWGTMKILLQYWRTSRPFRTLLTRIDRVPASEAPSYGAPYVGESVLRDIKNVITDFKPTKIFVSHPVDTNRDHRALYLFVKVALWDLEGEITPEVHPYIVHVPRWPYPRGFYPRAELTPPYALREVTWRKLPLPEQDVDKKHRAILCYNSQIEYEPSYLVSFARQNELFGDYPHVELRDKASAAADWREMEIPGEAVADETAGEKPAKNITALAYDRDEEFLFIRLKVKNPLDKAYGVQVHLLGYRKGTDFAEMPKIRIVVGMRGMKIWDKRRKIAVPGADVRKRDGEYVIRVPLVALGYPHYVMANVTTYMGSLQLEETAWRILQMKMGTVPIFRNGTLYAGNQDQAV
jgi:LmbE family N-acetylglucosaminyl deacetylase